MARRTPKTRSTSTPTSASPSAPWPMGADETLVPLVSSVNIACGAHAGDADDDPPDRRARGPPRCRDRSPSRATRTSPDSAGGIST